MSRPTPQMRDIAERLIDCEAGEIKSSGAQILPAAAVCEKLRPHLTTLMGQLGFSALLSRALTRAKEQVPLLRAVHVNAQGALESSDKSAAQVSPAENIEGSVALLAQLLGLLVAFIGESLTLRLLREIWPKLSLIEWDFDMRDNE